MDKTSWETVVAIVLGIIIGILIASSFWLVREKKITLPKIQTITQKKNVVSSPTPIASPKTLILEIKEPEKTIMVDSEKIILSAKTLPDAKVVISQADADTVFLADENGNIKQELTLALGENEIVVTAIKDMDQKQEVLLVVYEKKE